MKKGYILSFILGVVITASIVGVYAINASQIDYRETKVDQALDDVYSKLGTKMAIASFGTPLYAGSQGSRIANRTATIQNVSKGKYIVIDRKGIAWNSTSTTYETANTANFTSSANEENLKCGSKNCVIQKVAQYKNRFKPTDKPTSGYIYNSMYTYVYFVEMKEDTDTISAYINEGDYPTNSEFESLIALPIIED
jgi:hypothetical protein